MSFLSKIALTLGTAASLAAASAPAMANPYGGYGRGGYSYGGYGRGGYGGYGGYRHRDNTGAIVAGALLIGGIAAIAASSSHRHDYDDRYRGYNGYDRGYDRGYYNGGYNGGYRGYDAPPPRDYYGDGYYGRPYGGY